MIGLGLAIPQVAVRGSGGGAAPASLPLDGTTSSVLAFSAARKLRTSYSSNAIRVRRSSDDTEKDFGFDGNAVDTSAILTFCGAGDGFIVTNYDQKSGTANSPTQATAANQPQIVAGGALVAVDGFAAADFDGINDELATASNTGISGAQERAVVLVIERDNNLDDTLVDMGADTGEGIGYTITPELGIRVAGGFELYATAASSGLEIVTLVFPAGSTHVTDHRLYRNGAEVTASSSSTVAINTENSKFRFGAGGLVPGGFDGRAVEVYLFNDDLSGGVRETLESNIAAYYGITLV